SESRANLTDPDSNIMRDSHGYLQGYNAQAVVTANQIIVAADVTQEPSDNHQLAPMVASAQQNLTVAGVREPIGAVVADAGYWSQPSAACDAGPELFIATKTTRARAHPPLPRRGRIPASATPHQRMERKLQTKRVEPSTPNEPSPSSRSSDRSKRPEARDASTGVASARSTANGNCSP